MILVEICAADDHDCIARLLAVMAAAGGTSDDWHESSLGVGMTRIRFGSEEATLFRDAWVVDLHGPEQLVEGLIAALREY